MRRFILISATVGAALLGFAPSIASAATTGGTVPPPKMMVYQYASVISPALAGKANPKPPAEPATVRIGTTAGGAKVISFKGVKDGVVSTVNLVQPLLRNNPRRVSVSFLNGRHPVLRGTVMPGGEIRFGWVPGGKHVGLQVTAYRVKTRATGREVAFMFVFHAPISAGGYRTAFVLGSLTYAGAHNASWVS